MTPMTAFNGIALGGLGFLFVEARAMEARLSRAGEQIADGIETWLRGLSDDILRHLHRCLRAEVLRRSAEKRLELSRHAATHALSCVSIPPNQWAEALLKFASARPEFSLDDICEQVLRDQLHVPGWEQVGASDVVIEILTNAGFQRERTKVPGRRSKVWMFRKAGARR